MITDSDVRTAKEQAKDAGALVLLLLLLRDYGREVRFDRARGVFVVDGKVVGVLAMRKLVAKAEAAAQGRLRRITEELVAGRLALREWRARMRAEVAAVHLVMAALASGSLDAAKNSQQVQRRIEKERRHVDGFVLAMKAGKVSPAMALARAASYVLAAAVTYSIVEQVVKGVAGRTHAKRIRRAAESCPGCRIYARRWLPIEVMPPIGSLDCGSHCRCYLIYR